MAAIFIDNPFAAATLILLLLLLLSIGCHFRQRLRWQKLLNRYQAEHRQAIALAQSNDPDMTGIDRSTTFADDLNRAQLTTRFQPSRIIDHGAIAERTAPERYRYARRLSESGMDAGQISALLTISSHEAEQLVRLTKIAQ